jgi:uncharacterized protein YndB with AHSA1/START domain
MDTKTMTPDISSRPHQCTVEQQLNLAPDVVFGAFTENIDGWFAAPGAKLLKAELNVPFYFETEMEGQRHPHYGRYLDLVPGERVQMTWVTGNPGTLGAETVVTVEMNPQDDGTSVKLTHAGFADEESRDGHAEAWPLVFDHLENCLGD